MRGEDEQHEEHRKGEQHLPLQVQVVSGAADDVVAERLPVEDEMPNQSGDEEDSEDVVQVDSCALVEPQERPLRGVGDAAARRDEQNDPADQQNRSAEPDHEDDPAAPVKRPRRAPTP